MYSSQFGEHCILMNCCHGWKLLPLLSISYIVLKLQETCVRVLSAGISNQYILLMEVILKLKFTEYYTDWLWHGWNRTGGRGGNGEGILQKGFPPPPSSLSVSSGLSIIGMLFFFHIRFSIMIFLLWYLLPSCASYQWRPPPWRACWRRSARPPTEQLEGKGSETCKAQWGQGWDNDHGFLDAGREW